MESREKRCDLVIVGGGLVGGTLAQALAHLGLDVVVIDENNADKLLKSYEDGRSYAISLGSKHILEKAGIWGEVHTSAHPIEGIKVGTDLRNRLMTFHYQDVCAEPLGFLIEASLLRKTILSKALSSKTLTWLSESKLEAISCAMHGVTVTTDKGDVIHAPLLVAADGANSTTRERMRIPTTRWQYDQQAFVFNVAHAQPHNNTAIELFGSEGPFAMLPYPGNRSGCVWSLKKKYAVDFLELSTPEQEETLNIRFGEIFGPLKLISKVKSFPLGVQQPHTYIGDRFVMVGDAAHAIHPVAGQGLNLGFRDLQVLCDELQKASQLGLDIGSQAILKAYQRKRRYDNLSLLALTDLSARGFATQKQLLRKAFSTGFGFLDNRRTLKKYMMRHAMGVLDETDVGGGVHG